MSGGYFIGEAVLKQVGNLRLHQLQDDLIYVADDGRVVLVPRGFLTDFASVPRVAWPIFPPDDPLYRDGALVHDFDYFSHEVPQSRADATLHETAGHLGCGWARRNAVWSAVRVGGCGAYRTGPARQWERIKQARDAGWI